MLKTHVTIGKLTEGFVTIDTGDNWLEFNNVTGTLKETITRFCENNAVNIYHKAQQISYYMPIDKIELVIKTLKAENA